MLRKAGSIARLCISPNIFLNIWHWAEQISEYLERLKTYVQTEVKQSEPSALQEMMLLADIMESLFPSNYSSFEPRGSYTERTAAEEPALFQIDNMN